MADARKRAEEWLDEYGGEEYLSTSGLLHARETAVDLLRALLAEEPEAAKARPMTRDESDAVAEIESAMFAPSPADAATEAVREAAERLAYTLTPPINSTDDGLVMVNVEDARVILSALAARRGA